MLNTRGYHWSDEVVTGWSSSQTLKHAHICSFCTLLWLVYRDSGEMEAQLYHSLCNISDYSSRMHLIRGGLFLTHFSKVKHTIRVNPCLFICAQKCPKAKLSYQPEAVESFLLLLVIGRGRKSWAMIVNTKKHMCAPSVATSPISQDGTLSANSHTQQKGLGGGGFLPPPPSILVL